MINRRHALLLGSGCLAGLALITRGAVAQSKYPERPIRLVVPVTPGGITDALGRQWAHAMKALLGPVVIENQPGGGGVVGTAAVAHAQPDGYVILLGGTGPLVLMSIAASHPLYDPVKDFAPVSILVLTAVTIVVNPSVPAGDLNELAAYAKANPGRLSYGSAGLGTINQVAGELFKSLTGAYDIVHVPYKGSGQAITDLIGGQILMAVVGVTGQVLELHQTGKLRMLAVTTPTRIIAAPDIPTAVEQALPIIAQASFGLFAPAGTPSAIANRISDATRAAMDDHAFREKLIASGFEPYPDSSPEAARRFVQDEIDRLRPVVKAIGLKVGMRNDRSKTAQREPITIL
jgi:tripartite-type tricarboxylate transporter receptor subunit TctC